jgi:protein TonB
MERNYKITAQTHYYRLFLPVLITVIGTILFGCQNKEDKNLKVKNGQAVKDTIKKKQIVSKEISIDNKNTDHTIVQTSSKINHVELKNSTPIIEKEVMGGKNSKPNNEKKEGLSLPAKSPSNSNAEFPGGIDQFHSFFMKEYKKPENVNYWKLNFTLAFAVEKNGSVSFIECSPGVEEPLEKEIIRVLSLCPKWMPGESNGKKIRMQYSVPILLK